MQINNFAYCNICSVAEFIPQVYGTNHPNKKNNSNRTLLCYGLHVPRIYSLLHAILSNPLKNRASDERERVFSYYHMHNVLQPYQTTLRGHSPPDSIVQPKKPPGGRNHQCPRNTRWHIPHNIIREKHIVCKQPLQHWHPTKNAGNTGKK